MTDRVRSFPIEGIEHLFSPSGLPLTQKGESVAPATSILVRGGAGVGKTTLAVGLAHGIATHLNGAVLYLGTEFVPHEIKFKGSVLGTDDVLPWSRRAEAKAGSIVVQHLAAESEAELMTSLALKRHAVEEVWRMIELGESRFRAVVIDAFISPDAPEGEVGLRATVLALVQALEARGVSPILVQEEVDTLGWLAFVVDVVVGLAFVQDQETGALQRKLTLTKSRYSISHVGPHDYGLDNKRPAVWPNALAVVMGDQESRPAIVPAGVVLPGFRPDYAVALPSGGVVLSDYGTPPSGGLRSVLTAVPGARMLDIVFGPLTMIGNVVTPDWEGPFSIAWAAIRALRAGRTNVVRLVRLETLINRPRFTIGLVHLVETLAACNVTVLIEGDAERLTEVFGARFAFATKGPRSTGVPLESKRRSALRWIGSPLVSDVAPANDADAAMAREMRDVVRAASEEQNPVAAMARLGPALAFGPVGPQSALASLEALVAADRYGGASVAVRQRLDGLPYATYRLDADVAWTQVYFGRNGHAVRIAYAAIANQSANEKMHLLFAALCAAHARNVEGLRQLQAAESELTTICLVEALAAIGAIGSADRAIDVRAERVGAPTWLAERAKAEMRLDSTQSDLRKEGGERLVRGAGNPEIPAVHRAEMLFNAGLWREEEGDRTAALALIEAALRENPSLDVATDSLIALGGKS